jgi:transcription elongation factor S-II
MEEANKIPLNLTFVRRKASPPSEPTKLSLSSNQTTSSLTPNQPSVSSSAPRSESLEDRLNLPPQNGDRSRIREKFMSVMENGTIGANIEKCLYYRIMQETGRDFPNDIFRQEYLGAAHNLLENLDPEGSVSNKYLQPLVISGQITPDNLVRLSDHDLYPPKWQQIKDRRLKEITTENEMQQATSDLYKCGKCGKRETTFYQLQTRSMDEPTTSFINCVNCGHRWKD